MFSRRCPSALATACAVGILASSAGGCRHEDEDLGLHHEDSRAVALDRLTDPASLLAALAQPGAALDPKLGARGFDLVRSLELSANGLSDLVEENVRFEASGKGGFALTHELSHPRTMATGPSRGEGGDATRERVDPSAQGMEAIALDGRIYLRPRYARFVERRPEPDELDQVRAIGEQLLADDLELLAPALSIAASGEGVVLGRPTRKFKLSCAVSPIARVRDDDPRRAWRASVRVTELSGELELDGATGAPRSARLLATYEFDRTGRRLSAHLRASLVSRAARPIAAPTDTTAGPHRPRPTVERNQLLEGLAPPIGTNAARAP